MENHIGKSKGMKYQPMYGKQVVHSGSYQSNDSCFALSNPSYHRAYILSHNIHYLGIRKRDSFR